MARLIQHRQQFRLGTFFRRLSMEGPFVDVATDLGIFPDEAAARRKAQALLSEDATLGFELSADDGTYIGWMSDEKPRRAQDKRHEWLNWGIQFLCLMLLTWLALGFLNDGLFSSGTLAGMTFMGAFFGLASLSQNQIEAFVLWVIFFALILLFFPAHQAVQKAVERHRAAERATAAPAQPSPDSR